METGSGIKTGLKHLIGFTQGRLVHSESGHLQCFPQKTWQAELQVGNQIGIDYIEWLVERQSNPQNPIWTKEGIERIHDGFKTNGLKPYSAVNDYTLDHDLTASTDPIVQTRKLLDCLHQLSFSKVVLPLYDASEISGKPLPPFIAPLREIADHAAELGIEIFLETVLTCENFLALIERVDRPNISVCFDLGNRITLGQDIYEEIGILGQQLRHVHVKDKDSNGHNVILGTGKVDFYRAMQSLADIGYGGAFTFETPRGREPARTAQFHKSVIEFFMRETELEKDEKDQHVAQ